MGINALRFVFVADNHGDRADPHSVKALFEFMQFWKPEIRIHGGDCFDLRAFRKKASEEERLESIKDDVEAGLDFMARFRPTVWLRGNHDERLIDMTKCADGNLSAYARLLWGQIDDRLTLMGCSEIFPYDAKAGVLRLGHLKFVHGYHNGITAARVAAQIYGSVIMGHVHAFDEYSIPGIDRRVGRSCGCLCELRMDYNRAMPNTLRQSHGWYYGFLFPDDTFRVYQAEEIDGQWIIPTEFGRFPSESACGV